MIIGHDGSVILIRRKKPPFEGKLALPGGFVDVGETVETACRREVLEETELTVGRIHLVGVYSDPKRDPRFHTVSVVYRADMPEGQVPKAGDDAAEVFLVKDWKDGNLAFDHGVILDDAMADYHFEKRRTV